MDSECVQVIADAIAKIDPKDSRGLLEKVITILLQQTPKTAQMLAVLGILIVTYNKDGNTYFLDAINQDDSNLAISIINEFLSNSPLINVMLTQQSKYEKLNSLMLALHND